MLVEFEKQLTLFVLLIMDVLINYFHFTINAN